MRAASVDDAEAMGQVLREIIAHSGRQRPNDVDFVMGRYIADPANLCCTVAIDGSGDIVGFQSLKKAVAGNPYDTPEGWGIIGTHISPRVHRQGVGKLLFSATRKAARQAVWKRLTLTSGPTIPPG